MHAQRTTNERDWFSSLYCWICLDSKYSLMFPAAAANFWQTLPSKTRWKSHFLIILHFLLIVFKTGSLYKKLCSTIQGCCWKGSVHRPAHVHHIHTTVHSVLSHHQMPYFPISSGPGTSLAHCLDVAGKIISNFHFWWYHCNQVSEDIFTNHAMIMTNSALACNSYSCSMSRGYACAMITLRFACFAHCFMCFISPLSNAILLLRNKLNWIIFM